MGLEVGQNKDLRITFRLTRAEFEVLQTKVCEAGYKGVGAFIRDAVIAGGLKPKITRSSVDVAVEIFKLASLIKDECPGHVLLEKLAEIALINRGVKGDRKNFS